MSGEPSQAKLPQSDLAFVEPTKLTAYILNLDHPVGRDKAAFLVRFGFALEAWEILQSALVAHAGSAQVVTVRSTLYGTHYTVEGQLMTPDGRNPRVRTVWSIGFDDLRPRFLTAYPGRRGGATRE